MGTKGPTVRIVLRCSMECFETAQMDFEGADDDSLRVTKMVERTRQWFERKGWVVTDDGADYCPKHKPEVQS